MGSINRNRVISLAFLIILESFGGASKVTAISAYNSPTTSFGHIEPSSHSQHQISSSSIKDSFAERRKHSGNVIFNDNHAFSPSPTLAENEGSKRKKSLSDEQNSEYSHHILAGGYLKNHRLEGGHISASSTADAVSASAAAVVSPNFYNNINDQVNDNSQHNNVHRAVGVGASGSNIAEGTSAHGTHGRAFSQYNQGNQHGWASNPGSCLFSCSGGNIGNGAVSCCQQNYVQCCPNPHQETLNFKNLHHGRGLIGGNFGKSGYSWGPAPYNPPPIIRKPCQAQPYSFHPGIVSPAPIVGGAGALLHKGVETIKNGFHNIGHLFKDHVEGGIGWGAGGNGAAGYYFHRRSDKNNGYIVDERSHSPQKRRLVRRSIPKGGDFVQPCPVYSAPPNFGWPSRPPSVGLGSLIGWSRPVNHIQTGFIGGGGYYGGGAGGGLHQQHVPGGGGYGLGWGGSVGRSFCKWDYECPGIQKCCKGTCQLTPYK